MIVGVIGSGSIGPDLAYGFISALAKEDEGKLFLHDIDEDALAAGIARINGYAAKGLSRGKLSAKAARAIEAALVPTLELTDLADCDYVMEAASENLEVKKAILKELEKVVRPDCLIGFATSGIPREQIVREAEHPERCFVNHPFFPAWRSLPVEVVLSDDEDFSSRMIVTLRRLGKVPIITADVACFAADDVFCNYCAEAARIVAEGTATPAQVDMIVNEAIGGGGPFNVMDLTRGNLLNVHCLNLMAEAPTGNSWFDPPPIFVQQADQPWHDPDNPGDPSCDEKLARTVIDRIVSVLMARTYYVVDNGICDPSDFNWLSANALGFRKGLLDLAEEAGADHLHQICTSYAENNPGFEVPESIARKDLAEFYRNIVVERRENVAVVTIRRPEVMNSLNDQTIQELESVFEELAGDDEVAGIVLTSFDGSLAGADIMELARLRNPEEAIEKCRRGHSVMSTISAMGKPVVAAVDGPVLGGGAELSMACHARVAGRNLMLGQPEVNLGIIPGYGGTQRLPRLIGLDRSLEMLRTGKPINAGQACALGWAAGDPAEDIIGTAIELIQKHLSGELTLKPVDGEALNIPEELPSTDIGHHSLVIDSILIDAVRDGLTRNLEEGLEVEAAAFGRCRQTVDYDIGMKNFIQNGPRVQAVFLNE